MKESGWNIYSCTSSRADSEPDAVALWLQVSGRPPSLHRAGGAGGRQQSAGKRPPVAPAGQPPHPDAQQEPNILRSVERSSRFIFSLITKGSVPTVAVSGVRLTRAVAELHMGLDSEPQGPLVESEISQQSREVSFKLLFIKGVKEFCCFSPEMKHGAVSPMCCWMLIVILNYEEFNSGSDRAFNTASCVKRY